jgi:hypothetical protein
MNPLVESYKKHHYMVLFYSLLFSIVAIPVFTTLKIGRALPFVFALNLIAAILPIASGFIRKSLILVLLLILGIQLISNQFYLVGATIGGLVIWTCVALMTAVFAIKFTLKATSIHSEQIYAALSAYLLAGVFLGHLYWILEKFSHGSLLVGGARVDHFQIGDAIYFSFITLATLGYGDIVPGNDIAKSIAIVEAVAGQLYLAVMIARLVSLYVTRDRV